MKRLCIFFFFLLFGVLIYQNSIQNKQMTQTVFSEKKEEMPTTNRRRLSLSRFPVTNKTLPIYFDVERILSITPAQNNIYSARLKYPTYYFYQKNYEQNMNQFVRDYTHKLEMNGWQEAVTNSMIQGIPIETIELSLTDLELQQLLQQYPNIKVIKGTF